MNLLAQVVDLVKQGKGRDHIKDALGISLWKARELMAQAKVVIAGGIDAGDPLSHHNLIQRLKTPKSVTELACELGVDSATVEEAIDSLEEAGYPVSRCEDLIELGRSEEQVKLELKLARLKREKSQWAKKFADLVNAFNEQEESLGEKLGFLKVMETADPRPFVVADSGRPSQSTAFLVASDWHLEETVHRASVNGLNEFNLDIAERRIERLFQNGLKLVDMCRSKSEIETLVLAVLGDLITGYIHEELIEENALSPTQASLKAFELLCSGLDLLVEHGNFRRILVPCCYGNHGRTTEKPRVSTGYQNSYEWMLYQFLARKYAGHPVVQVKVAESYFNLLEVYGRTIRFHHGDGIRYKGGVGGITVPLNKAIAQWNKGKPAYLDVMGHWHTRQSTGNCVVNGSIIGYNAYAIQIKADFEHPCQSFFLLHPERGKTVEAPVYVE